MILVASSYMEYRSEFRNFMTKLHVKLNTNLQNVHPIIRHYNNAFQETIVGDMKTR